MILDVHNCVFFFLRKCHFCQLPWLEDLACSVLWLWRWTLDNFLNMEGMCRVVVLLHICDVFSVSLWWTWCCLIDVIVYESSTGPMSWAICFFFLSRTVETTFFMFIFHRLFYLIKKGFLTNSQFVLGLTGLSECFHELLTYLALYLIILHWEIWYRMSRFWSLGNVIEFSPQQSENLRVCGLTFNKSFNLEILCFGNHHANVLAF